MNLPKSNLVYLLVSIFLFSSGAQARVAYDAGQLMMKNSDQVTELVRQKIKSASDIEAKVEDPDGNADPEPEAVDDLSDAMRIALARPDQDGLRGILFGRIRRETDDLGITDKVLKRLSDEGISILKSKDQSQRLQATYIVLLENLMSEIRPELQTKPAFKAIVESIHDAKIKINGDLKMNETLGLMKTPVSPSETAGLILPKDNPKDKKKK